MRKTKSTKRALLMSGLALFACISMLVGSTFAWFTDSVTSGRNVIAAGNLDIELLVNGTDEVDSTTVLFNNSPWEPGVVVYENLQVANVGSLALKYQMSLNVIGENYVLDTEHKLSEVVKVAVLPAIEDGADRAEILAAAKASGTVCNLADFVVKGELLAETKADAQAIVIFWEPGDNDNNWNVNNGKQTSDGQPLHIDFGIELVATQYPHEEDSFGKDYDEGLDPTLSYVSSFDSLRAALEAGKSVVLQDDIVVNSADEFMYTSGNGALIYVSGQDVTIDLNGYDIVADADALMDGKTYANAVILVNKSTLNIVGDGSVISNNFAIPVYGLNRSVINIYGGNFKTNASERNESAVYVNNPDDPMMIHVYGGNFMESDYAFNVHDTKCGNTPVITLHEGVVFKNFLKNGTTDVFASDLNAGRIVLAEGTYLKNYELDGKLVHEVAKKQDDANYSPTFDDLYYGWASSGTYVLDDDLYADNYIYFADGTDNTIDLNGNTLTAGNPDQPLFVCQGSACTVTIEGDGTVAANKGIFAGDSGVVTIKGGTYQLGETSDKGNLYCQNSANIVIEDGNFISTDPNTPILYCINGFIEIKGGFFQNTANPDQALLSMGNNLSYVNNQKITISGGTFVNWSPMDSAFAYDWPQCPALIVVADGYEIVSETQDNGDIWYTVVPKA